MIPRTVSIIIPVFNEASTVGEALLRARDAHVAGWKKEIIVINDGSTDNSLFEIRRVQASSPTDTFGVFSHPVNKGKGSAIKTALQHAIGDYILIHDADLEYDTADWHVLLKHIPEHGDHAVYGSRTIRPKGNGYTHYVLGAWLLTTIANLLFGSRLTDIYTGHKVIPTPIMRSFDLVSQGFEFEAEITAKLLKQKTPSKR